jgi:hypothetical protein
MLLSRNLLTGFFSISSSASRSSHVLASSQYLVLLRSRFSTSAIVAMSSSPDFSVLLAEFKSTAGKTITCKAAVAWEAKKPLDVTDVQVKTFCIVELTKSQL